MIEASIYEIVKRSERENTDDNNCIIDKSMIFFFFKIGKMTSLANIKPCNYNTDKQDVDQSNDETEDLICDETV